MLRSPEVFRRSSSGWEIWSSAIAILAWVTARTSSALADVNHASFTPFYEFAFLGAAFGLLLVTAACRAAWPWSDVRRAVVVGATVAIGALTPILLVLPVTERGFDAASLILGAVHLGLLAVIASQLALSPRQCLVIFALGSWVIPALLPAVRPLLDASPAFEALTFPRSPASLAPILTLAVFAIALPLHPNSPSRRGAQK